MGIGKGEGMKKLYTLRFTKGEISGILSCMGQVEGEFGLEEEEITAQDKLLDALEKGGD